MIRLKNYKILCFFAVLILDISIIKATANHDKNLSFFKQRYLGWYWFEDIEQKLVKKQKQLKQQQLMKEKLAQIQARAEIEQFKQELENLKYMMLRYPDKISHMKRYKEKEAIMLSNALLLANTSRMTNFLYPDLNDELENPLNLYGRRIKQEIDKLTKHKLLKKLAKNVELFLFFSNSCPYCETLSKHLNSFARKYGFVVDAISLDNSKNKYFKTYHDQNLVKLLKLEVMPTVIAVTKDSKNRFEIARGAVSISDLEAKALLICQKLKIK